VAEFTPIIDIAAFAARIYIEFVAERKRRPGAYSYAGAGTDSIGHLQTELFKSLASVFTVSSSRTSTVAAWPRAPDTSAGQVAILLDNLTSVLPFIRDGRLIPIVVASSGRVAALPTVPTFKK